jgi:hypothetical protein
MKCVFHCPNQQTMHKINIILSAALILLSGACKSTLMKKYSVGEPCIESIGSVRESLDRYSPQYEGFLCVFRDSAALVDWFRNSNLPGRSHFYNRDGYRIITQDSNFCSGVETDFAKTLSLEKKYRIDSVSTFAKLGTCLLPAGDKVSLDPSQSDFTVVIFWARFMGKINDASFQIASAALNSPAAKQGKVNILFVDMDIMDFWKTSGTMIKTMSTTR